MYIFTQNPLVKADLFMWDEVRGRLKDGDRLWVKRGDWIRFRHCYPTTTTTTTFTYQIGSGTMMARLSCHVLYVLTCNLIPSFSVIKLLWSVSEFGAAAAEEKSRCQEERDIHGLPNFMSISCCPLSAFNVYYKRVRYHRRNEKEGTRQGFTCFRHMKHFWVFWMVMVLVTETYGFFFDRDFKAGDRKEDIKVLKLLHRLISNNTERVHAISSLR